MCAECGVKCSTARWLGGSGRMRACWRSGSRGHIAAVPALCSERVETIVGASINSITRRNDFEGSLRERSLNFEGSLARSRPPHARLACRSDPERWQALWWQALRPAHEKAVSTWAAEDDVWPSAARLLQVLRGGGWPADS